MSTGTMLGTSREDFILDGGLGISLYVFKICRSTSVDVEYTAMFSLAPGRSVAALACSNGSPVGKIVESDACRIAACR